MLSNHSHPALSLVLFPHSISVPPPPKKNKNKTLRSEMSGEIRSGSVQDVTSLTMGVPWSGVTTVTTGTTGECAEAGPARGRSTEHMSDLVHAGASPSSAAVPLTVDRAKALSQWHVMNSGGKNDESLGYCYSAQILNILLNLYILMKQKKRDIFCKSCRAWQ